MKEHVVGAARANDQIFWTVIGPIPVNVVNLCPFWQGLPNGFLRNN